MKRFNRSEDGSALVIAAVVMALLSLIGLSYLFIADTENQIAMNQRDSVQLLFVAEAGAHMVEAWFNKPTTGQPSDPNTLSRLFLDTLDMRNRLYYDRAQRLFDHDGDPNTPDVLADGTPGKPFFREGMTVDPNAPDYLSFFDKPRRGTLTAAFMGSEAGPDMILESNSLAAGMAGSVDILDQINAVLFTDQPNTGRIERIEFYKPPVVLNGGVEQRYGFATVKITAAKYRHLEKSGSTWITTPASRRVGERMVKIVLNEFPFPTIGGPFNVCKDNLSEAGGFKFHWGIGSAKGIYDIKLGGMDTRRDSGWPWQDFNTHITGPDLTQWVADALADGTIEDPWIKFQAGGRIGIVGAAPQPDPQPFPYNPASSNIDADHSNMFQNQGAANIPCPQFDYVAWKAIAQEGGTGVFYFTFDTADFFFLNGQGVSKTMTEWFDDATGLGPGFYFFDTADGNPPTDTNADGFADNLTPALKFTGNSNTGFLYLNAVSYEPAGGGNNELIVPPPEPYNDTNGNGQYDDGELHLNIIYPTVKHSDGYGLDPVTPTSTSISDYDYQGNPIIEPKIAHKGVIYNAGKIRLGGNTNFYGAMIAQEGVASTAGSPDIFFDTSIANGSWPPPQWDLPRVYITLWQTDL